MQIIALERPVDGVPADAFTPAVLREEAGQVWALYQSGSIRQLFFRADRHEAVLFLEMPDLDSAEDLLGQLPLVRAGLISFDLIPLRAYPGFARLFAAGTGPVRRPDGGAAGADAGIPAGAPVTGVSGTADPHGGPAGGLPR